MDDEAVISRRLAVGTLIAVLAVGSTTAKASSLQWSGFALARATAVSGELFDDEGVSAQVQLGIDWLASPRFNAHLHLIGRDDDESKRGNLGIAEAWVEGIFTPAETDRLRLRAGAMFLPGSRENVDALWESPYTMTSSALNSWMGEEFRPIGIDATYMRRGFMAGGTVYRGNDTFGALPPVRGWKLHDRWTLLGQWVPVDDEYFTSVSAETDGRLGWSARGGWSGERFLVQLTRIDNRSDALEYGHLFNWRTWFNIAALELNSGDWTVASEYGWGPTIIIVDGQTFESDLLAAYVLVSRRFDAGRISARGEMFGIDGEDDTALTVAWLFSPRGPVRAGFEVTTSGGDHRVLAEVRYSFSGGAF